MVSPLGVILGALGVLLGSLWMLLELSLGASEPV